MNLNDFEDVRFLSITNNVDDLISNYENEDIFIKCNIAANINCPIYILETFAKIEHFELKREVVFNVNCPISALKIISKCNNIKLKNYVTQHYNYTSELLEELSENKGLYGSIISNKNCSFETLKKIYKEDEYFREFISSHSNWKLNGFK